MSECHSNLQAKFKMSIRIRKYLLQPVTRERISGIISMNFTRNSYPNLGPNKSQASFAPVGVSQGGQVGVSEGLSQVGVSVDEQRS